MKDNILNEYFIFENTEHVLTSDRMHFAYKNWVKLILEFSVHSKSKKKEQ